MTTREPHRHRMRMRLLIWMLTGSTVVATVVCLMGPGSGSDLVKSVLTAGGAFSTAMSLLLVMARFFEEGAGCSRSMSSALLRRAAGLLPVDAAARYAEEWRGELYDLRAEGARWWQRAHYVAGVLLYVAPRLAVALRLSSRRAVD